VAGASVEVDGLDVGKAPLSAPIRVATGAHVVGISASGFAPQRKRLSVAASATAAIDFQLEQLEGRDVIVGGEFSSTLDYGGAVADGSPVNDIDAFVVRLKASDGSPVWAVGFLLLGRSAGVGATAFGLASTTLDYTFLAGLKLAPSARNRKNSPWKACAVRHSLVGMKALLVITVVLFGSTGCGSSMDVSERPGDTTQALSASSGQCVAQGNGSAGSDLTFAFALDVASGTRSVTFSTSSGALIDALVTTAHCAAVRDGSTLQFTGTGTWAGMPGHRFVLRATDDARSPSPGRSFDSVRVRVVSPSGEDVADADGSLQSGNVTVSMVPREPLSGRCAVSIPGVRLGTHERFSFSVDSGAAVLGHVTHRRTGGGPPSAFEGPATEMLCRQDGVDIADIRGIGAFNGVDGYTWAVNVEDERNQVRFSIFDIFSGFGVFTVEQTLAAGDVQFVLSEP
jgi:hypothetical protein